MVTIVSLSICILYVHRRVHKNVIQLVGLVLLVALVNKPMELMKLFIISAGSARCGELIEFYLMSDCRRSINWGNDVLMQAQFSTTVSP
jgi:hypothetical protein